MESADNIKGIGYLKYSDAPQVKILNITVNLMRFTICKAE